MSHHLLSSSPWHLLRRPNQTSTVQAPEHRKTGYTQAAHITQHTAPRPIAADDFNRWSKQRGKRKRTTRKEGRNKQTRGNNAERTQQRNGRFRAAKDSQLPQRRRNERTTNKQTDSP